jgi:hypothetical protein
VDQVDDLLRLCQGQDLAGDLIEDKDGINTYPPLSRNVFSKEDIDALELIQIDGKWTSQKYRKKIERDKFIALGGYNCPRCNALAIIIPKEEREKEERVPIKCPECHANICSKCARIHHLKIDDCSSIIPMQETWQNWLSDSRDKRLTEMTRRSESYKSALVSHESARRASIVEAASITDWHKDAVGERPRDWGELHKMCDGVGCGLPLIREGGCNHMTCGSDIYPYFSRTTDDGPLPRDAQIRYEHKNRQNLIYMSVYGKEPCWKFHNDVTELHDYKQPKPKIPAIPENPIKPLVVDGRPVNCSNCKRPIQGIYAKCINCENELWCIRCHDQVDKHEDGKHTWELIEVGNGTRVITDEDNLRLTQILFDRQLTSEIEKQFNESVRANPGLMQDDLVTVYDRITTQINRQIVFPQNIEEFLIQRFRESPEYRDDSGFDAWKRSQLPGFILEPEPIEPVEQRYTRDELVEMRFVELAGRGLPEDFDFTIILQDLDDNPWIPIDLDYLLGDDNDDDEL